MKNWILAAATSPLLFSDLNTVHLASADTGAITLKTPSPPSIAVANDNHIAGSPPFVNGKVFVHGVVQEVPRDEAELDHGVGRVKLSDVYGCCAKVSSTGSATAPKIEDEECPEKTTTTSSSSSDSSSSLIISPVVIGTMPQFTQSQSLQTLQSAVEAWKGGSGTWPQMSLSERISSIQSLIANLQQKRNEIINVLMWEIGKNYKDAAAEFDRTIQFIQKTISYIQSSDEFAPSTWDETHAPTKLYASRAAIGIILCLGPYNYPLNETYATLIPALLMGNIVLLKVPTVGGLVHLLTMEAFAKSLPKGTVQLISGSGRTTMPPLMESGKIDGLAFIGGSRAADRLIKAHPEPHRLKLFLQLEAKNMGIYLPDLFENGMEGENGSDWDKIMEETVAGTLSYNGQRCTALKLLFVPKSHSEKFATTLAKRVERMSIGLPWELHDEHNTEGSSKAIYSQITPLPNLSRVSYMKELIADAIKKGASIVNRQGGDVIGGPKSTLMVPAVLHPVTPDMKIYEEEQFGPIIPVAPYDSLEDDVVPYARDGKYGQQVSIFTSKSTCNGMKSNALTIAKLIDPFSTIFGKININSQCGRSPDAAPFSGRRSSALGVMSVRDALIEFSVPTVISYKDDVRIENGKGESNCGIAELITEMERNSTFLTRVN